MPSAKQHYEQVLSDVYSWLFGGVQGNVEKNLGFFRQHNITPRGSGIAFDLGAGSGFQSIPLARLGFGVTAVDFDRKLLEELVANMGADAVSTVQDDLLNFDRYTEGGVELVVCMTDTVLHLESPHDVRRLFAKVHSALDPDGRFVLTFRDLSQEVADLDRFIFVRSDDDTLFTCFLEYEPDTVKVHDLVHRRQKGHWQLYKSYYRKLRLSKEWMVDELTAAGFEDVAVEAGRGMVTVITTK